MSQSNPDLFGTDVFSPSGKDDTIYAAGLLIAGEAAVREIVKRREKELGRPLTPEEKAALLEAEDQRLLGRVRTLADQFNDAERELDALDRKKDQFFGLKGLAQIPRRSELVGIQQEALREARGLQAIRFGIRRRLYNINRAGGR